MTFASINNYDIAQVRDADEAFYLSHELFLDDNGEPLFLVNDIPLGLLSQIYIYQKIRPTLESIQSTHIVMRILKKYSYDWQAKFIYGLTDRLERDSYEADGFIIFDPRNQAIIESMQAVNEGLIEEGLNPIAILSDPGMKQFSLCCPQSYSYSMMYSWRDEIKTLQTWRRIRTQLDKNALILSHRLKSYNMEDNKIEGIIKFIYKFFKQTIRDIYAVDKLTDRIKPNYVVTGTDSHKLGRLFALLGHHKGWKTLVIQHGFPGLHYAYVPVFANYLAVWGHEHFQWFSNNGVPEEKLIVTGNPRFDTIQYTPCRHKERPSKVVLLTSINRQVNENLLVFTLEALNDLNIPLLIKPHPSDNMTVHLEPIIRDFHVMAKVVNRGMQLKDIIHSCDIVITENSTAGVEALALGGQLHTINVNCFPKTASYHKLNDIVSEADSPVQLRQNILKSISDSSQREDYVSIVNNYVYSAMGQLDGSAKYRVASVIKNIT